MISHNQNEQLKLEAQKARHALAMQSHWPSATMNSVLFNKPKRVQREDESRTQTYKVLGYYNDIEEVLKRSKFNPFPRPKKREQKKEFNIKFDGFLSDREQEKQEKKRSWEEM